MLWIESIGIIAGILGIVAWVPQIYRIWIEKKADGISVPTFIVIVFALVLWLIYGFLVDSIALIISNIMTLIVIIAVLIGAFKVQKENKYKKPLH